MADTPKTSETTFRGIPAPVHADYSDDFSTEQWEALTKLTKDFQDSEGSEIVSGEPW